jgi:hypothetical protein
MLRKEFLENKLVIPEIYLALIRTDHDQTVSYSNILRKGYPPFVVPLIYQSLSVPLSLLGFPTKYLSMYSYRLFSLRHMLKLFSDDLHMEKLLHLL